jgi:hypothetical protein
MIFIISCLVAFILHGLYHVYGFLIDKSLISSPILLFGAILLPLLLFLLLIIFLSMLLTQDLKRVVLERNNSDIHPISIPDKDNNPNSLIQVICSMMDDEGRAYLSDDKLEWKKSKLTQAQINIKCLRFVMSHYRGRFVSWLQLPRFLPPSKTR